MINIFFLENKKGFMTVVILLVLASLLIFGFTMSLLSNDSEEVEYIGNTQLRILYSKEVEQDMFLFLDEAIKVSVLEAYDTVKRNQNRFGCDVMVYPLVEDCDILVNETFENEVKSIFNAKLANYPIPYLRQTSFDFYFEGYSVEVDSQSPISIPIYPDISDYRIDNFPFSRNESYTNRDGFEQFFGFYGEKRIRFPKNIVIFHVNETASIDDYMSRYKSRRGAQVYNYLILNDDVYALVDRDRLSGGLDCDDSQRDDCVNVSRQMISIGIEEDSFDLNNVKSIVSTIQSDYTQFNASRQGTFIDANDLDESYEKFNENNMNEIKQVYD